MFTDASVADHRQGRASLHAELLSSKTKREQALRSILTARRRQILNQRSHESSRIFLNRTLRPNTTSKDPPDVLETQETKHNVYVTSAQTEASVDEKTSQSSRKNSEKKITSAIDLDSMELEVEQQTPKMTKSETPSTSTTEKYESASSTSSSIATTSMSTNQKSGDADTRKKNIVSMPESLYKHFRPVESNIPMEDMSQFLYFGQKLQPDAQNVTSNSNNNSVETTSTIPISSRRRYSSKRYSATIAAPIEEIMNDEMNIALERRTVEKNQVSRIKNMFRNPGSGLYYRKPRPTADVVSNVISSNESSSVDSGSDMRSEMNTVDDKLRGGDPFINTGARVPRERGNGATHVAKASTTTQIPRQRHDDAEASVAESEINVKFSNETVAVANGVIPASLEKMTNDFAKDDDEKKVVEAHMETTSVVKSDDKLTNVVEKVISPSLARTNSRSRDINNIEASSPRTESSTLRIVVPDDSIGLTSFAIESERAQRNTVKPQPVLADRPVRVSVNDDTASKSTPSTTSSTTSISSTTEPSASVIVADSSRLQPQQQHVYAYTITNVTRLLRNYTGPGLNGEERRGGGGGGGGEGEEEDDGATGRPGSGAEITSDGPSQQQQQPPPPLPPSSPLLLPRVGAASIELARTPAGLSTGATIEPAAAVESSPSVVVDGLVGERPRKVIPQQQQRASSQRAIWSSPHPATNNSVISTTRSIKSPDTGSRGPVRWNQVKSRISEQEGANDRRFLRKSASAVLNQRSTVNEESSSLVTSKGRRISAFENGLSPTRNDSRTNSSNQEKIKSTTEDLTVRETVGSLNETITSHGNDSNDEVLGSSREIARVTGEVNKVSVDGSSPKAAVMGNLSRNSSATDETMNATDPSVFVDAITMTEADKSDVLAGDVVSTPSVNDEDSIGSEDYHSVVMSNKSSDSDANVTTDSVVATTVIVTERIGETIAKTTTTTTTSTTPAAPVFPVTPRILTEGERSTVDPKALDAGTKAPEASNLDPSEIQKRYRAKDATTSTTTMVSPIQNDSRSADDAPSKKSEVLSTSSTPADNGKRVSGERSPEVRARNLSDKSKDKDDVLPIMHLYNTSDIFNGSRSVDGFVRGTERTRVVLPVDLKPQDEKNLARTTTTTIEKTSQSTTTVTSTTEISASTSTIISVPKLREPTASTTGSRKDKHEENRSSQDTTVPSVTSRGSSFAVNRTRYRPTYHHSILPEYNGTIYHPAELNRTFLEVGGPISVSPREPMNISDVISKRHDGNAIATQETVAVVSYILATLVVFPIAVGFGLILRRLILRNRKVSDFEVLRSFERVFRLESPAQITAVYLRLSVR